jgi:hypothetical protein
MVIFLMATVSTAILSTKIFQVYIYDPSHLSSNIPGCAFSHFFQELLCHLSHNRMTSGNISFLICSWICRRLHRTTTNSFLQQLHNMMRKRRGTVVAVPSMDVRQSIEPDMRDFLYSRATISMVIGTQWNITLQMAYIHGGQYLRSPYHLQI